MRTKFLSEIYYMLFESESYPAKLGYFDFHIETLMKELSCSKREYEYFKQLKKIKGQLIKNQQIMIYRECCKHGHGEDDHHHHDNDEKHSHEHYSDEHPH